MTSEAGPPRKATYGFDAGYIMPAAGVSAIAALVFALVSGSPVHIVGASVACFCIGTGLHTTRRGKFLVWRDVLDGLHLRGDERLLDVGCGRGAVLIAAAKRLPKGRAVGVDIWSRGDQSGNGGDSTLRNAAAEGVSQRVAPLTANMMALPFPSNTFDVIVSNIAIHNINGRSGRATAIDEAARVLRPGGRLLIADLAFTGAYARRLAELGMADVSRRSLGWRMWCGGPWKPTYLVTATKPDTHTFAGER